MSKKLNILAESHDTARARTVVAVTVTTCRRYLEPTVSGECIAGHVLNLLIAKSYPTTLDSIAYADYRCQHCHVYMVQPLPYRTCHVSTACAVVTTVGKMSPGGIIMYHWGILPTILYSLSKVLAKNVLPFY